MPSVKRRLFAVIPAAGLSRRMGQPKLLLPFGPTTVIGSLLQTLADAEIVPLVLIRPGDRLLRDEVARTAATLVEPQSPPAEMRVSIEHLLKEIERQHRPGPDDGWLLIPADHPLLRAKTLRLLIDAWDRAGGIVVPTCNGVRGHPTLFSWSFAESVARLPADVGVNELVRTNASAVIEVPVDDSTIHLDLDTPDDYAQALELLSNPETGSCAGASNR